MKNLKIARILAGMSQQDLAEKLKVTNHTISRWERGSNEPNLDTLKMLATILKVSTDYLLGRK